MNKETKYVLWNLSGLCHSCWDNFWAHNSTAVLTVAFSSGKWAHLSHLISHNAPYKSASKKQF